MIGMAVMTACNVTCHLRSLLHEIVRVSKWGMLPSKLALPPGPVLCLLNGVFFNRQKINVIVSCIAQEQVT